MNPIQRARILLIAEPAYGRSLLDKLRRLGLFEVNSVDSVEEARRLCARGAADACLVVVSNFAEDLTLAAAESAAPGRDSAVPWLLLADIVTPAVMDAARRCGYASAVPITSTGRPLYRSIGAVLQRARRTRTGGRALNAKRPPVWTGILDPLGLDGAHKPTLH